MDKLISVFVGDRACDAGLAYLYLEVHEHTIYSRVNKYSKSSIQSTMRSYLKTYVMK